MRSLCATRIAGVLSAIFAALVLVLAISTRLLAQEPAPKPSPNRPSFYPAPSGADADRMERDKHFRDLEMIDKVISKEKPKSNEREREIALRQATEDFQRLLEITRQPLAPAVGALDYKLVLETTSEIEKRATRLKSNLVLPVIVTDKKKKLGGEMDDEHLRASLSELNQLATNFVTNPVFYGDGSINPKLQAQAARDLDSVIELSGSICKRVEKTQKSAARSK